MKVYLGADHAGFYLKERIKKLLDKRKIRWIDVGNTVLEEGDDYPDFAFGVAEGVYREKGSRGILICGTGSGMCIAANKVKGIRAAAAFDKYTAKMSRVDNDSNILCLRGRKFFTRNALKIVNVWLSTEFSGKGRHRKRIDKISEYESAGRRKV